MWTHLWNSSLLVVYFFFFVFSFRFFFKFCALDTRLSYLPFMTSPLSMFILVAIYLYIVRNGKKWMEHRNPMEIQQIMVVYNIVQIIANSALFLVVSSLYCKWMTFWINSTVFRSVWTYTYRWNAEESMFLCMSKKIIDRLNEAYWGQTFCGSPIDCAFQCE